jgi:hypothetical protein
MTHEGKLHQLTKQFWNQSQTQNSINIHENISKHQLNYTPVGPKHLKLNLGNKFEDKLANWKKRFQGDKSKKENVARNGQKKRLQHKWATTLGSLSRKQVLK